MFTMRALTPAALLARRRRRSGWDVIYAGSATPSCRADVDKLTVNGYGPFPYQVDGDYLGETEQLEFATNPRSSVWSCPVDALAQSPSGRSLECGSSLALPSPARLPWI